MCVMHVPSTKQCRYGSLWCGRLTRRLRQMVRRHNAVACTHRMLALFLDHPGAIRLAVLLQPHTQLHTVSRGQQLTHGCSVVYVSHPRSSLFSLHQHQHAQPPTTTARFRGDPSDAAAPVDVFKVWMFNITNIEAVQAGGRPQLVSEGGAEGVAGEDDIHT